MSNYNAIKKILAEEISQAQDKNSVEACGILSCITKPDFVVCAFVFHSVLSIVDVLSRYFQSKNATLGRSSDIITGTITSFEESKNQFDGLWSEIEEFAEERDISLDPT